MSMTARSLFDTFFNIGMTGREAFDLCNEQGIFSRKEMEELKKAVADRI